MTLKFRQRGQLLSAEVTAQPFFPQTSQPRGARSFHPSHTHHARSGSEDEHGAGRQAAPGREDREFWGRRILAKVQRERAGEWELPATELGLEPQGGGSSRSGGGRIRLRTRGVHGELVWLRGQRVNYR